LHLQGVTGDVAHIHMVAKAEPGDQMSIDFGGGSRIKQASDGQFADICSPKIVIGLGGKAIGRAGIV